MVARHAQGKSRFSVAEVLLGPIREIGDNAVLGNNVVLAPTITGFRQFLAPCEGKAWLGSSTGYVCRAEALKTFWTHVDGGLAWVNGTPRNWPRRDNEGKVARQGHSAAHFPIGGTAVSVRQSSESWRWATAIIGTGRP